MPKVELRERNKDSNEPKKAQPVTVTRRRWWPRMLLVLVIAVLLLPSALSIFGQVPIILKKVHPRLASIVSFRTIHLHWWAPVEISGLDVRDVTTSHDADIPREQNSSAEDRILQSDKSVLPANGEEGHSLLTARTVRTQEPLWKIVARLGRGISYELIEPELNLILDDQGSNLQRTLHAVAGRTDASEEELFAIRVMVHDGRATLRSLISTASDSPGDNSPPDSRAVTYVTGINGTFSTLDSTCALPELQLQAFIQRDSKGTIGRSDQKQPSLPFAASSRGSVNPRLAANLDELTSEFSMSPLQGLDVPTGEDSSTSNESIVAATPEARVQIAIAADSQNNNRQSVRIAARQLDLRLLHPLLSYYSPDLVCDGEVSCNIQAELAGRTLTDGVVGRFLLEGQQVRLRQSSWMAGEWLNLGKTSAAGAAAVAADGLLLKDITMKSDVMSVTGNGELRHVAGSPSVVSEGDDHKSLSQAMLSSASSQSLSDSNSAELKGSVDIASVAGMLPGTLSLRENVRFESGQLVFGIRGEIVNAGPGRAENVARWQAFVQNDGIKATQAGRYITLDSTLRLDAVGPIIHGVPAVTQARVTGEFGNVDVTPIDNSYQITAAIQPDQLWQQIQQFVDVPKPGIRGSLSLQSSLTIQQDHFAFTELQVNSSDLKVGSNKFNIYTDNPLPSMLDGSLHVEGSGAAIRTLLAPWHSATWLAEYSAVVVDLTADPQRKIQLRARIQPAPVAAAVRTPVRSVSQTSVQTTGIRGGSDSLSTDSSALQIDEATVDLVMQSVSSGSFFEIQSGRILLPGIVAQVTGTVGTAATDKSSGQIVVVDIAAETEYDLNVLCNRLLSANSQIQFNGRSRGSWRITGAPSLLSDTAMRTASAAPPKQDAGVEPARPLRVTGGISWDSGELWGMRLGAATMQAVLENGIVKTQPIQCSLSSGEINVMPQFDVINQRLKLATGSRIENLAITPELCQEWLGYLAPVLANSTSVNGVVSARVERFDYLLNQPAASDIAAAINIQRAEASPGNSLLSMLETVDLIRRAGNADRSSVVRSIVLPQQQVQIEMRQGLIIHQGLMIDLAGYRASSSGAVGLDRQLQIDLDIQLDKPGAAAAVRTIRIPLRGTIDSPQPDTAGLLQSLGTQTIEKKLNESLDKQLNKLFDRF